MANVRQADQPVDDIERALITYVNLPEVIDLRLHLDGIDLKTSNFPALIRESSGLDLRLYFQDAFAGAEYLSAVEKEQLSADLFSVFSTVEAFISSGSGALMRRVSCSTIPLPAVLSQGFVQEMRVESAIGFRLWPLAEDEVIFSSIEGITFRAGRQMLSLTELHLKVHSGKCVISPVFKKQASLEMEGRFLDRLSGHCKDFIVSSLIRLGGIKAELPVIEDEFRLYLKEAAKFRQLLSEPTKDLVMFFERTSGGPIEDPLTKSLLEKGVRVLRSGELIEIERQCKNCCDAGGIELTIEPSVRLKLEKRADQLNIDSVTGIGLSIPFEPPAELEAIGLDLKRSIPKVITGLKLGERGQGDVRRLVVETAAHCWVGVDVGRDMRPLLDSNGNWALFGVTNNPISGSLQKFFLRLDSQNNLSMSGREITEVITQTALDGFDPNNPFTWSWAAVALGGKTLLAADAVVRDAVDPDKLKKNARKLGQIIGRILEDF